MEYAQNNFSEEGKSSKAPVRLTYIMSEAFSKIVEESYQAKNLPQIKKNRYIEAISMYGIYVLCYMIEKYQEIENYEECALILSAIEKYNEITGESLPSVLHKIDYPILEKSIRRFGMTEQEYLERVDSYAEKIHRDLKGLSPALS